MGIKVIDATTDRTITGINVIDAGGTDRSLVQINVIGPDGADRIVWSSGGESSSLAVVASPTSVSGSARSSTITTGSTTATASGGTAPYSYKWTLIGYDNDTYPPRIAQPTSASTSFTQQSVPRGNFNTATFAVTATDSATPTPATASTTVSASWSYLL